VSGCARGTRDMRTQHFLGSPHYRPLDGKRSLAILPTLQPLSKTKLSVQA